jgi:hypothetical protein
MTVPAAPVASSDSSSATPLENDVGAMFGDFGSSSDEESPVSGTTSAAGTTPAEPTPETATEPSAGTEAAGTTATPAPSDGTTPSAATALPAEDDPFKDTTPATYVAQGRTVPVEDIRVFKEGGAVIRPEALPNILSKFAERDNLYEQNRAQYDQVKDYERLSEWKTQGEDGKEQIVSGRAGLIGMRTGFAQLEASFNTMIAALRPDAQGNFRILSDLVDAEPPSAQYPQGRIIVNQQALDNLLTRAELAEARATETVRSRLAEITQPPNPNAGRSAAPATTPDSLALQAEAPRIIELAAKESGADSKLLNDKDKAFLSQQLPRYVRTVTEDDRANDYKLKVGSPIVDGAFTQVVKDRVELRKEVAATSQATEKATKEGQARMAQAARGVKPAKPQATTQVVTTPPPGEERATSEGELFDSVLRSSSRALRAR